MLSEDAGLHLHRHLILCIPCYTSHTNESLMQLPTMAVPETPKRIEEARRQSKTAPQEAEQTFKDILSKGPGTTDAASRDYENALMGLGELYRDHKKAQQLSDLVEHTRGQLSSLPKAKTAKIGSSPLLKSMRRRD